MCTGGEVAAAGAVISAGSSILGGRSAKKAGKAAAAAEEAAAMERAKNIRKAGRETRSAANAAFAASGVDVNGGGTPDVIQRTIAYESELDAINAILSGKRNARALRKGGQAAQTASVLDAGATLASAYGGWQRSTKGG
jgi:hypothetical protein